jgi:hypothetical protein
MLEGRSAFAFAAVSAVTLTVLGMTLIALHGLPLRYKHQQLALSSPSATALPGRAGSCFLESGGVAAQPRNAENCPTLNPSRNNYILIGDSGAARLWNGLQKAFPTKSPYTRSWGWGEQPN